METKKELTKEQRKAEIIRKISEILDRHTKDEDGIYAAISAMLEMKEFIFQATGARNDELTYRIRRIRKLLISSSQDEYDVKLFDDMTDFFVSGILLYVNHEYGIETIAACHVELETAMNGD